MRKSIAFIDGYRVGDTITRVKYNTSGTTGSIERQHGLNGNVVVFVLTSTSR
jgi:hypothetical protein